MSLEELGNDLGLYLGTEVKIYQIGTGDHVTYRVQVGPPLKPDYLVTLTRDQFKPGPPTCWGHIWARGGSEYTLNEPNGAPAQEILNRAPDKYKHTVEALFHKLT